MAAPFLFVGLVHLPRLTCRSYALPAAGASDFFLFPFGPRHEFWE